MKLGKLPLKKAAELCAGEAAAGCCPLRAALENGTGPEEAAEAMGALCPMWDAGCREGPDFQWLLSMRNLASRAGPGRLGDMTLEHLRDFCRGGAGRCDFGSCPLPIWYCGSGLVENRDLPDLDSDTDFQRRPESAPGEKKKLGEVTLRQLQGLCVKRGGECRRCPLWEPCRFMAVQPRVLDCMDLEADL